MATNKIVLPTNITLFVIPHKNSRDGAAMIITVETIKMISNGMNALVMLLLSTYLIDNCGSVNEDLLSTLFLTGVEEFI